MWILTTRFNQATWQENMQFRNKHQIACLYGLSCPITVKIGCGDWCCVLEMNNELNKLEGIGLIRNILKRDIYYKVYEERNLDRYTYVGKYHLSREYLKKENPLLLELLETMVFKGKSHLKRGSGMTMLTDKIMHRYQTSLEYLSREIKTIFKSYEK
jgi:hypothetical protein